ncbi:hypothetical protein J6500_20535 [Bradyrhizobium sp. WSM 1704]|uniref:hypothetical protein n=1 Tax=Bradyrhizobium semiaridum TaxID=2821404 RepID=UPI001CE3AE1D|nr:hypothetical protein [Bradyrhizobium semiaridum]MCA6124260.1 hypothetical protein [Bradyrhizobium semiaridum]
MKDDIVNSAGVHVAVAIDSTIFDVKGRKLYDLKGNRTRRQTVCSSNFRMEALSQEPE